jgi:hypothetical protein
VVLNFTVTSYQTLDRRKQQHSLGRIGIRCKARSTTICMRM